MTTVPTSLPHVSIPSLRSHHFCCKPSCALPSVHTHPCHLYSLLNWLMKRPLTDLVTEQQREADLWWEQQLTQKYHHWSSPVILMHFGVWEASWAWRSTSKRKDGDEGLVWRLDPQIHLSSSLCLLRWSRLGEMLSRTAAGEEWKEPSLVALEHLRYSSVWYLDQNPEQRVS